MPSVTHLFAATGAALILAAAGCGSHPHRGAGTEIDHAPTLTAIAPAGGVPGHLRRLTIGEVVLAEEPSPDAGKAALPVDAGELRKALRTVLRDSKAFDDVKLAEERDAAGEEHGVVLETEVLKSSLRRAGDEESTMGTFVTWFFLGWVGDWQHDQTYRLEVEARFTLRNAGARAPLLRFDATKAKVADALSMFERRAGPGGVLATVVWYPQFWLDSQAAAVTRSLAPACLTSPVRELLDRMTKAAAPAQPPPPPPAPTGGTVLVARPAPPVAASAPSAPTKSTDVKPPEIGYRVVAPAPAPEGFMVRLEGPEPGGLLARPACDLALTVALTRPSRDGRIVKLRAGGKELGVTPDRKARGSFPGLEVRPGKPIEVQAFADKRKEWVTVLVLEVKQEEIPAGSESGRQP